MITKPIFKGKKARIRAIHNEKDFDNVWQWMNDPEVTQNLLTISPISYTAEKEYFSKVGLDPTRKNFAIEDKVTGEFIGLMDINKIDLINRCGTTGAVIGNKDFWRKGYGSDAKMLVLNYAFNTLNLKNIFSDVTAFNERSLGALKKTGYEIAGRYPSAIFRNGQWYDKIFLYVTREKFYPLWKEYYDQLEADLAIQS